MLPKGVIMKVKIVFREGLRKTYLDEVTNIELFRGYFTYKQKGINEFRSFRLDEIFDLFIEE